MTHLQISGRWLPGPHHDMGRKEGRHVPYVPVHPRMPRLRSTSPSTSNIVVLELSNMTFAKFSEFLRFLSSYSCIQELKMIQVKCLEVGLLPGGFDIFETNNNKRREILGNLRKFMVRTAN